MKFDNPLFKVPAKFGVFGAAMIIIMFFIFHFSGSNPLTEMGFVDFFIIPIFLFFGIKEFKDSYNQKLLEYWEGMTAGFVVYITIAILTSLFIFLFINLSESDIVDHYIVNKLEILEDKKDGIIEEMGEETYLRSKEGITSISIFDITLDNFLKKTFIGLLLTIMIAVIMRRKPIEELA
ncbi:MAG: hypothetical protein ACJA2S_000194 [Cyclobacteriaceae bacterium]|jgi:hypothetical protein